MTTVRIYQPAKIATQSGKGKTKLWVMEFETDDSLTAEPLVGWVKAYDMSQELSLSFLSLEEALQFAKIKGFSYTVYNPCNVFIQPKNYAFNFTCPRVRGG